MNAEFYEWAMFIMPYEYWAQKVLPHDFTVIKAKTRLHLV